jgi:ribosomal protein S18 acetylase RimI-like enzyme
MHHIVLAHVGKGSAQSGDYKPVLDEASETIANLPDPYARARRQLAMDRALKGSYGTLVFSHCGAPVGMICYDVAGDEAQLVFGHILCAHEDKKADAFRMAVLELEKQYRVVRSNFNWPAPETFSAAARAMGFTVVERLGMSREADARHAVRPLPEGLKILPYSSEYFEEVAGMMCETSDPMDRVVNPLFTSVEGCRILLGDMLGGVFGVFKPELTYVACAEGRLAGYLITASYTDGIVHIDDVAVADAYRGKGLASAMIDRLIQDSGAAGDKTVELAVTSSNQVALRLYLHKGFRATETFMQHILVCDGRKKLI